MKVNPSPATLDGFRTWLAEAGRTDTTADRYLRGVRASANHARGYAGRLTEPLAPKTLHTDRAALRAYATYTDDGDLLVAVRKIRIPPARRATPKVELAYEAWRALVAAIKRDPTARPAVRSVLLVMALRGLRVGDILRVTQPQLVGALETGRLVFVAKGRKRLDYAITNIREPLAELASIDAHWTTLADLVSRGSKKQVHESARRLVLRELKRIAGSIQLADVYNHRLRRTYATHFLRTLKGDPQAIMKLQSHMQWASPSTAMEYVDAINADELDLAAQNLIGELQRDPPAPRKR